MSTLDLLEDHPADLVLVSGCLAGLRTRYDGRIIQHSGCLQALTACRWIPICPEQLGGLATPRCAADIIGGNGEDVLDGRARVVCRDGADVTEPFISGARQVLDIAQRQQIDKIYLKSRSPSCGVRKLGVTAALLIRNGFSPVEFD
jgi:uncharacterized protein YbbK (DUF523 family)